MEDALRKEIFRIEFMVDYRFISEKKLKMYCVIYDWLSIQKMKKL
jgi:hypothetical protein